MNMRKFFAGVAAAATLLGSLALGAATANADANTKATITVNNSQTGHTYSAYKFATFSDPVAGATDGNLASVNVNVVNDTWNTAIKTALDAAKLTPTNTDADTYTNNYAAYLATLTGAQLRTFADNFALPTSTPALTPADTVNGNGNRVTLGSDNTDNLTEGWYFITDKNADDGSQAGPLAVVATQITDQSANLVKTYTKFNLSKSDEQNTIDALGVVNAKAEVPTTPDKTVSEDTEGTAKIGQELTYTIKADAPKSLASYESYDFTFTDTPSTGLTIAANTKGALTINGLTIAQFASHGTVTPSENLTSGFDGDGNISFTVTLDKTAIEYAIASGSTADKGTKLTLSYKATVNESAVDEVTNKATVNNNSGTSGEGTTTTNVGDFNFKKIGVDSDANGLAGAEFQVREGSQAGTVLNFKKNTDGTYTLAKDQSATGAGYTKTLTSPEGGVVKVIGLAKGDYYVEETKAPTDYAQNFKVTFKVTIDAQGNATFEQDALKQLQGTADGSSVLNVKSITQLPLTGAAGTALFTVLGLLLAGAAVTVYTKSRSTSRALRA